MRSPLLVLCTLLFVLGFVPHQARAHDLVLVPTLGFVTAGPPSGPRGDALRLREAHGGDALRSVRRVAPRHPDLALATSAYDYDDHALTLRFALDSARPVALRALHVTYDDGREETVPLGHVTVAPSPDPHDAVPALRRRALVEAAGFGLFQAELLVNEGDTAVHLEAWSFAPAEVTAAGLLVRPDDAGAADVEAFDAWTRRLTDHLSERWFPLAYRPPSGTDERAAAGPRPDLSSLATALDDGTRWADPADLALTLAPGQAAFVALTPAAFDVDVRDKHLSGRPLWHVRAEGEARSRRLSSPGSLRYDGP